MQYIIPILYMSVLCAGWVLVQILAKKMKTKNHFDHLDSACGHCTCGAEISCTADDDASRPDQDESSYNDIDRIATQTRVLH